MLVAAAVCPHPPLLIPAAAGGACRRTQLRPDDDAILEHVRAACHAAVAELFRGEPDLVVVVGGAEAAAGYDGSAAGTLRAFGIPFVVGSGPPVLPLSLTVGAWLLCSRGAGGARGGAGGGGAGGGGAGGGGARDGTAGPGGAGGGTAGPGGRPGTDPQVQLRAVATDTPTADCLRLGAQLAREAPRVALLAMGDGSARKASGIPGAADLAADNYDAGVAAALAAADPGQLAMLDPALDDELAIAGRAAWQVLAGAARGCALRGMLRCAAAPYDVSYLVASWERVPGWPLTH